MSDESKTMPLPSQESSRPSIEQSPLSPSSRPSSGRRKSWLPANTRDPVVREPWCSEVILVLKAVDEHLTSGFDTAYPPSLTQYCSATVWADFIKDINKAAKLKRKHKFVLSFRPMVSRVKVIRNAINAKLDKRTKPMLMMLNYWQDILKTYGLRAELRKGGQSIDKRLITPPSTSVDLRNSELFTSGHSSISSSRSIYRSSMTRGSTSDLQEFGPIRPAYLQSNSSRASLASHGSFAFGAVDTSLSGNWELVLYSYKKRSEMRSMYRRSRRYSTMSVAGSPRSGRPTTAMMLGDDSSVSTRSQRRQSRSTMLTLEDLAKMPLPAPRSPFNPSEPTSSNITSESLDTSKTADSQSYESNAEVNSCKPEKSSSTTIHELSQDVPTCQTIPVHKPVQLNHDKGIQPCDVPPVMAGSCPPAAQGLSNPSSAAALEVSTSSSVMHKPQISITIPTTQATEIVNGASKSSDEHLQIQNGESRNTSLNKSGIDIRSAQRPDSLTHSPLSSMAMTAQRMSADMDESAETMHRNSVHKLSNRFSVSNFLHLASSVLTKSSKEAEDTNNDIKTSSPMLISASDEKTTTVVQQNEIHTEPKNSRPRSSSFMTVVATPLRPPDEVLDATSDGPTLRVVTSQQLMGGSAHDITEVKSLLSV